MPVVPIDVTLLVRSGFDMREWLVTVRSRASTWSSESSDEVDPVIERASPSARSSLYRGHFDGSELFGVTDIAASDY